MRAEEVVRPGAFQIEAPLSSVQLVLKIGFRRGIAKRLDVFTRGVERVVQGVP